MVGSRDGGLLEGCLRGTDEPGLFPSHCVRDAPPTIPQASANIRRNSVRPSSDIKHFATAPRKQKQSVLVVLIITLICHFYFGHLIIVQNIFYKIIIIFCLVYEFVPN